MKNKDINVILGILSGCITYGVILDAVTVTLNAQNLLDLGKGSILFCFAGITASSTFLLIKTDDI